MNNFILKISLPGIDVEDASPEDCTVHSDYDTLKLKIDNENPHYGSINITFKNNPLTAKTFTLYTINHMYNYLPFYYFFYSIKDSTKSVSFELGNFFSNDVFNSLYFKAVALDKKINFNLIVTQSFVDNAKAGFDTVIGNTYSFRYYVFANDSI